MWGLEGEEMSRVWVKSHVRKKFNRVKDPTCASAPGLDLVDSYISPGVGVQQCQYRFHALKIEFIAFRQVWQDTAIRYIYAIKLPSVRSWKWTFGKMWSCKISHGPGPSIKTLAPQQQLPVIPGFSFDRINLVFHLSLSTFSWRKPYVTKKGHNEVFLQQRLNQGLTVRVQIWNHNEEMHL